MRLNRLFYSEVLDTDIIRHWFCTLVSVEGPVERVGYGLLCLELSAEREAEVSQDVVDELESINASHTSHSLRVDPAEPERERESVCVCVWERVRERE